MVKRIVIYDSSGGIGSTTASLLRASGHELHLVGGNREKLAPLAAELDASFTVGDVCEESLFTQVTEEFDAPWDGLVYSVGTITLGSIRRLTSTDFFHDFQVIVIYLLSDVAGWVTGQIISIDGGRSTLRPTA